MMMTEKTVRRREQHLFMKPESSPSPPDSGSSRFNISEDFISSLYVIKSGGEFREDQTKTPM